MICPRCGATIKDDSRYCIKCGALNYDHPANLSMKKYVSEKEVNKSNMEYANSINNINNQVFVGGKVLKEVSIMPQSSVEAKNYKSEIVYVLLISFLMAGSIYFFLNQPLVVSIYFFLTTFCIMISFLAICNIYRKAGYSFFTSFIPFYNEYVLCEMLFDKGILFLLTLVPIVNIVFLFILLYKLGEKFGINGILSIIAAPIVILIIAFSDRCVFLGYSNKDNNNVINIVGFLFMIIYIVLLLLSIFIIIFR